MAVKVSISENLKDEIFKKFKGESKIIFDYMSSLKENPHKGKLVGNVGGILVKELKYKSFRFYFITDGYKLKLMNQSKLVELLIKFVKMSNKRDQQKTIDEIKDILKKFDEREF